MKAALGTTSSVVLTKPLKHTTCVFPAPRLLSRQAQAAARPTFPALVRIPNSTRSLHQTTVSSWTSLPLRSPRRLYQTSSRLFRGDRRATQLATSTRSRTTTQGPYILRSSTSSLLYLIPFIAIGIGGFVVYGTKTTEIASPEISDLDQFEDNLEIDPEMEGTLGNLTPEQQAKLCELWKHIYQICGVSEEEIADAEAPGNALQPRTDSDGSGQPKKEKKRLGLFKKKDKKEKENADGKATAAPSFDGIKENDADDKYGQNKEFLETLASRSPESIRHSMWGMIKMDHPDQLLLRFLRARKWDVNKALVMLISTMKWRQDYKVDDDIMLKGEEYFVEQEKSGTEAEKAFARDFLMQMRMGKSFAHGIDKDGRPINTIRVRLHKGGDQSQESLERYTVYLIETTRLMLHYPVETGCIIFDMTNFSMANMDYTPIKFMIQTFEANYPESLGVVLVHKSPWIFQGIWKVIRGWLDPVVAAKVHFTNNAKELSEYVPLNRVPTELDGEEAWTYQYVEPTPGENAKLKDTATRDKLQAEREALYEEFEAKTLEWIRETDAEKRKTMKAERDATAKKLGKSYWQLDPYVRARSLYDRVGIIKSNGEVDHYPEQKKAGSADAALDEKHANGVAPAAATPAVAVQTNDDDVD
ncbi:hypothetical protein PG990_014813 [Apiospora arundinis]|uniref:CRAL-TRIO domain-containing protein n=1 Tax=Apiospora arundinis TaxID=335852 RepID=A0ABR2HK91_9PEZI